MDAATTPTAPTADGQTGSGPRPVERMRAAVRWVYGTAETVTVDEVDRPVAGPRDVLVQVRAAGLGRDTWHVMTGLPYPMRLAGYGVRAPRNPVLGGDVAGVVVAVGSEVTRFTPGDEVFGIGRGSFAEITAADEDKLALKPSALTFERAAAVPISGATALQGVSDVGRVQAGQRVLVVGASGGVGTFAVQIAKALGAEVTGVCTTSKVDLVASIGADHVVDHTREDFAGSGTRYDVILDIGGNATLSRLRRALTPTGTLVIAGGEGGGRWLGGTDRQLRALALSPFLRQRLTTFVSKEHFSALERLTSLLDDGRAVPVVERTFPLADVPEAMRHLERGHARGKLVITP